MVPVQAPPPPLLGPIRSTLCEHAFLRNSTALLSSSWSRFFTDPSQTPSPTDAMSLRVLEIIFFLYFASHVPITLCIDLQALLPGQVYPQPLRDLLRWYAERFKDPMMLDPPPWFRSFIVCEALLQTPFFPVAAYAFLKGGCRWIRTPAIVYSTHVATTLVPILAHILFHQFPAAPPHPGPQTLQERWLLVSIYAPYLLVPVLILLTMLLSSTYSSAPGSGPASAQGKKKN